MAGVAAPQVFELKLLVYFHIFLQFKVYCELEISHFKL